MEIKLVLKNCDDEIPDDLISRIESSDIDLIVENDGIGSYEFWGHRGYDKGHDYLMLDGQEDITIEIMLENVIENINNDFETVLTNIHNMIEKRTVNKYDFSLMLVLKHSDYKIENNIMKCRLFWEEV